MTIYWITGLPGSGKSTLSNVLKEVLNSGSNPIVQLDGDCIRECFMENFGYSRNERVILGKSYLNLAILISNQGFDVIVSTVSLLDEIHQYIRKLKKIHEIKVIFINPSITLLNSRNQKNLRTGLIDNSPGINMEVSFPSQKNLELSGEEDLDEQIRLLKSIITNE